MTMQQHYEILGISDTCSDEELKEAYRDLVKVWHPDRFSGDPGLTLKAEERLKLVNAAYAAVRQSRAEIAKSPNDAQRGSTPSDRWDLNNCEQCGQALYVPVSKVYARCNLCGHVRDPIALWHLKAQLGNARAQYFLAKAYALGRGVPEDHIESAKWARKAADQGSARAQYLLAQAYSLGSGVPWDPVQMITWLRKSAEQGNRRRSISARDVAWNRTR